MAYKTIDEYIASFPPKTQAVLRRMREVITQVIPTEATETISYGVPTLKLNGSYVVYFAGFAHHVSIYPIHVTDESTQRELAPYRTGKGTVQFALDKPIPYELIKKIVRGLLQDNIARTGK